MIYMTKNLWLITFSITSAVCGSNRSE